MSKLVTQSFMLMKVTGTAMRPAQTTIVTIKRFQPCGARDVCTSTSQKIVDLDFALEVPLGVPRSHSGRVRVITTS